MRNRALLFLGAVACSENQLSKLEDTGHDGVPVPEFVAPELQPDCYNWDHAMDAPRSLDADTKANLHTFIDQAIVDPGVCDGDGLCMEKITGHNVLVGEALDWASENAECVAYEKGIFHYQTWDYDTDTLFTEVQVIFYGEGGSKRIRLKYANVDRDDLLLSTEYDGDATYGEPDVWIRYKDENRAQVSLADWNECLDRECPEMELYSRLAAPAYALRMTTYYHQENNTVYAQKLEWPMSEFVDGYSPWWYNHSAR